MKKRLQALRNEEGLTLVELLAVIVILAIIAVVAFVMIGQVIENSRQDAHIANAQQMIASTKLWEAQGGDFTDTSTAGTITLGELKADDMIDTIYDSWGDKDAIEGDEGSVTKSDTGEYSVELTGTKCDVGETEEDLVQKDRDTICGTTP